MCKEEVPKLKVGQCGGCGLKVRFWAIDGARVTCPLCEMDYEVGGREIEDLTADERSEMALLVQVGEMKSEGVNAKRGEQRN